MACSSGGAVTPDGASAADVATSFDAITENAPPLTDAPPAPDEARQEHAPEVTAPPPETPDGGDATSPPEAATRVLADLYCPPGLAAGANPFPADRTPRLVPIAPPGGISFLEGPVWLADRGVLLLSEWNGGHRVLQVTPPQAVEVFMPTTGSNGLAVTPDGTALLMISE